MQLKIQCPCGAKHTLDITPEMATGGIRFVCPACGTDRSAAVNQVVQQQLGRAEGAGPSGAGASALAQPAFESVSASEPGVATSGAGAPAAQPALADMPAACLKHPGRFVVEQCVVCGKPLCPVCMDETGYVCSVECRRTAKREGISIPVYAGQRGPAPRRYARVVGYVLLALVLLGVLAGGAVAWYFWVGTKPRLLVSLKLPADTSPSLARFIATDQIVYASGRQLKRFDLGAKREVWSVNLPPAPAGGPTQPAPAAGSGPTISGRPPDSEAGVGAPSVWVLGQDVWLLAGQSLLRLDWQTGLTNREFPLPGRLVSFQPSETALVLVTARRSGQMWLTRIDPSSGLAQTVDLGRRPLRPSTDAGSALGADQPQPARPTRTPLGRALGAAESIRALNEARNQAIERALEESEPEPSSDKPGPADTGHTEFINAEANVVELFTRLLDKPAPAATPAGVAMPASRPPAARPGASPEPTRYTVTLRRWLSGPAPIWSGEVDGQPALFVLPTVDLLIAGQTVRAFDKLNKLLWEAQLGQPLAPQFMQPRTGLALGPALRGPCLQQGNALYVFDQGTLQAFDLMTGSVRWRLAQAGICQVQADEQGWLYVVSGSPVRPSRSVVLKVEPKSGKTVWRAEDRGLRCYLTGRFLYAVNYEPDDPELVEAVPYLTVWRLDPEDGRPFWEHSDQRLPVALDFQANRFLLCFGDELQVWQFRSPRPDALPLQ